MKDRERTPTGVRVSGKVSNLNVSGNTVIGGGLLNSEEGSIEGLQISLNRVFGNTDAVRLGDVFDAKIAGNLFSMQVPKAFAAQLKEAARSPEKKASLLSTIKGLAKPSEILALTSLIDRATDFLSR